MKVKKIVDLSHPIQNDTAIYPGDPQPQIQVATSLKNDGYNLSSVYIGTQTGSHVDAPYHFSNEGTTIDHVSLSLCMGRATVVNVSKKGEREVIQLSDLLSYEKKIRTANIVLFRTDWYKKVGNDNFFAHPYLSAEAAHYLLENNILSVAIDAINIDRTGGSDFPVHDQYSEADGLIAENLANFDKIDFEDPYVIFLPLKLTGCDGSPVRAVALDVE